MKLNEAISKKICKICNERNISVNKLASVSCLTQSTVQHLSTGDYKDIKLLTIVRLCDGLDMKLSEFFDDEIFLNIDRED